MLRYSFGCDEAAAAIDAAVESTLEKGIRTADIAGTGIKDSVTTAAMGDAIVAAL